MKNVMLKISAVACIVTLCMGALVACSDPASNAENPQQVNRAYMSKVNGLMDQLGEDLDSFVKAVSRGDLVNMRTQAENAYKTLDGLSELEAPEDLAEVKKAYVDGTSKLREALNGYIELYTDASADGFDQSAYDRRLAEVQSKYDEGVKLLKQGDETAAGK